MAGEKGVVLLDCWPSSYAMRVKIALAEKGVEYECKQENLQKKSSLLMEMNPVHKKVPLLIHDGKPISESLVIVQYIDEVWPDSSPLLPVDPYQRSQAKFWADFVDKKIYESVKKLWRAKGQEHETIKKEFIEDFKILEAELKDKKFFGGDEFGYVDLALVPITSWFYTLEKYGDFSIRAHCPIITSWTERCMERPSVSSSLPDPEKIYGYASDLKRKLGLD